MACIYSQARLSLCGLYLLPSQVEFMWPVFTPRQVEFMWPVFTRIPDAATVGDSGLCCLYSYPCDVCGALSICPLACWCH